MSADLLKGQYADLSRLIISVKEKKRSQMSNSQYPTVLDSQVFLDKVGFIIEVIHQY